MRIDSASGVRGVLIDAETGRPIRWAVWAEIPEKAPGVPDDSQPGDYEANRIDPKDAQRLGIPLTSIRYRGRRRLRFVQSGSVRPSGSSPTPTPSRSRGGICLPPGTGEEECEVKGCHRRADWYTHDTAEVEPVKGADGKLYQRVEAVTRHYFCSRCYRLPVTENLRGVESEVAVRAGRPE